VLILLKFAKVSFSFGFTNEFSSGSLVASPNSLLLLFFFSLLIDFVVVFWLLERTLLKNKIKKKQNLLISIQSLVDYILINI